MKIDRETHVLHVTGSNLSGSVFDDVNLSGATLEDVNMSGTTFRDVNLAGCSFHDVNMAGWNLHDANLTKLRIEEGNLSGAAFVNCGMGGMTIDGVRVSDLLELWKQHRARPEAGTP